MTLRGRLKKAGIGITMLDEALQSHAQESGELGIDPDHLDFARDVVSVIGSENILSTDTHVWKWDNQGVWKSLPDRAIKKDVQNILAESHDGITKGLVDSVADVLKTEIYAKEHEWNKNISAVNVQNGELSWNGSEWVLSPIAANISEQHKFLSYTTHRQIAPASVNSWMKFFSQIMTKSKKHKPYWK